MSNETSSIATLNDYSLTEVLKGILEECGTKIDNKSIRSTRDLWDGIIDIVDSTSMKKSKAGSSYYQIRDSSFEQEGTTIFKHNNRSVCLLRWVVARAAICFKKPEVSEQNVIEEIEAFVDAKNSFSAYEITKVLRDKGFFALHDKVRKIVFTHMSENSSLYDYEANHTGTYINYEPKIPVIQD